MQIISDKAQQSGKHVIKERWWAENGVEVLYHPLPCGDYILVDDKVNELLERKAKRGIEPKKMDFIGTYNKVVDTKRDIQELIGDICGKQHARFRDECLLAQNNGIQLCILVENRDRVSETRDLFGWQNPRMHRYNKIRYMHRIGKWADIAEPKAPPTSGATLAKACLTMELTYGVKFLFCTPEESARRVIELLTEGTNNVTNG